MQQIGTIFWSSVGKKIVSAGTGLLLVLYVIAHLIGNLQLLRGDPVPFNEYAHFLESLGVFLFIIELALLAVFLFHILMGVMVWLDKLKARPQGYIKTADAGDPSKKTWSSKNMIITGIILAVFTTYHVITFKYGPGVSKGYVTVINGVEMRDLYRLVVESFQNVYIMLGYVICMILLGLHLRHGFWSAFQSLGVQHPRLVPIIYGVGYLLAFVLAIGFLFIPIYIYFTGGAA